MCAKIGKKIGKRKDFIVLLTKETNRKQKTVWFLKGYVFSKIILLYNNIYIYYIIKFFQRKRVVQKPYCFLFSVCCKVEQTEKRKQLDF